MKKLFLALVLLPAITNAQITNASLKENAETGIKWTEGLTWQQVKAKAKAENKYIFVDAYATWCKPCKEMDEKVYTVDSVGDFLNNGFISVKLQMDATSNDNADVKSWYKTAQDMGQKYRISAYPSYIFFATNGDVVSKETGYKDPGNFIQVARNATDPSKQYFVLLKKYKQKKLDHAGTVSLIKMAQQIGDTSDYRRLLNSYYSFLHKQKKEKLYTKENIEFVASTLDRSGQVLFNMFYPDGREVNKVMQNNWYARKVVDNIIFKEKVNPFLAAAEGKPEPDWNILYNAIAKSYNNDYAGRNVLDAKIRWFQFYGDWAKLAPIFNDKMEKYGTDTTRSGEDFKLNNMANWIWEHVGTSKELSKEIIKELSRVATWMEGVVRRGGKDTTYYRTDYWHYYIDTYANLLHKTGRTSEAIQWEELAILKCKEFDGGKSQLGLYEYNLDKMKKGEPNWPIEQK